MFKKGVLLILFLLLTTNVFAIRLVEPISKELLENDFVGAIVPGQTLELIISKELGRFNSLELTSSLTENFDVSVKDYLESVKIIISSNKNTPKTSYFFSFILKGVSSSESIRVFFSVEESLLDVALLNYSSETFVNNSAEYEFLLINNSDADAIFKIKLDLPWYWLGDEYFGKEYYKEVIVSKQQKKIEKIIVYPRVHGEHYFNSKISMQDNIKEFTLYSKVLSTFNSKFNSSLMGFPFYSISLLPSYFLTSIVSLVFN